MEYHWSDIAQIALVLGLVPKDTSKAAMFRLHQRFAKPMELGLISQHKRGIYKFDKTKIAKWLKD